MATGLWTARLGGGGRYGNEPICSNAVARTFALILFFPWAVPAVCPALPPGVFGFEALELQPLPEEEQSAPSGLSDFGRVVGHSRNGGATGTPVVWESGNVHVLPDPIGLRWSREGRISPSGDFIVGAGDEIDTGNARGIVWAPGRGMAALERLPGTAFAAAVDANDSGWFAGRCSGSNRATLWHGLDEPMALGPAYSSAFGINELREVVGYYRNFTTDAYRPCFWDSAGRLTEIGGGGEPPTTDGDAYDVNNLSEVVGMFENIGAYIWRNGQLRWLPSVGGCDAESTAYAVSDSGWIVGRDADGQCHWLVAALWWSDTEGALLENCSVRGLPEGAVMYEASDINSANQIVVGADLLDGWARAFLLTPYNFNLSDPAPGIAGQVSTIQVSGLQPGQKVRLAAGFKAGAQALPNSSCLGGLLLIQNLKGVLPPAIADNAGIATFIVNVPATLRGQTLRLQAYDTDNCTISHSVDWVWE